jgi:hypothetical protein
MSNAIQSAGDAIPERSHVIEVRVNDLRQLFDSLDPSPFVQRDLDPRAAEFIEGWGRDLPAHAPLALLVHLDAEAGPADDVNALRDGIHAFFRARAVATRRRLRELFRRGRMSLAIALGVLAASILLVDLLGTFLTENPLAQILREGLLIGGWVAMWRPIEIFLYDWWPIRADAELLERLGDMPVSLRYR